MSLPQLQALAQSITDSGSLDHALVVAFLENVPDHVYFKDRESHFIALSASMVRLFGCASVTEVIGKTDFDFFDESHARPAFEDEQSIIRTGAPIIGKIEKEVWPDGRVTWAHTCKLPLRGEHGEIIGTFGISKDVTESKCTELALEKSQRELLGISRLAGMAEVATGVLHNVGNVLNSLNISANIIATGLRQAKTDGLGRIGELLHEHAADLGHYLTADPKGRLVPGYIKSLAKHTTEERARLLFEIESLQQNVEHIKEIVAMQQSYATMVGIVEPLPADSLMEDALRMNSAALLRHDVKVVREFQPVPPFLGERGKVLQILINLIRNAKYAADAGEAKDKLITVRITPGEPGRVRLAVQDNGIGISAENITRIFSHGFTTKPTGHGFGLHSSVLAAKDMKGTLTAHSDGPGLGANFILELPVATAAPSVATVA